MKRGETVSLALVFGASIVTLGCGAQAEMAPVAKASPEPQAQPPAEDARAFAAPAAAAVAPAPPPPPPPVTVAAPKAEESGARGGGARERGSAWSELDRARAELQSSAGDCATACRALGSMERATAHLCTLASSRDDQRSCEEARDFVLSGRDRVRASCGECPGGPSLDRGAPIPSTR